MTRTIAAAAILSLTLSVLPAAAADDASTAVTIRTLQQAGVSFRCVPKPNPVQLGQVITVGLRQVGHLVVGNMLIGGCALGPTEPWTPSTGGAKLETAIAGHDRSQDPPPAPLVGVAAAPRDLNVWSWRVTRPLRRPRSSPGAIVR